MLTVHRCGLLFTMCGAEMKRDFPNVHFFQRDSRAVLSVPNSSQGTVLLMEKITLHPQVLEALARVYRFYSECGKTITVTAVAGRKQTNL